VLYQLSHPGTVLPWVHSQKSQWTHVSYTHTHTHIRNKGSPWPTCVIMLRSQNVTTVTSAYNGLAYKKLLVIRNWFSFPNNNLSLFYVKNNMDKADSVIRNYRLEGTHILVPMLLNQYEFSSLSGTHFWWSSHLAAWLPDNWREPRQSCYRSSIVCLKR